MPNLWPVRVVICPCGADHSQDKNPTGLFYVSVADGPRFNVIAGPYAEHTAALADVEDARQVAEEEDLRAAFYAFGTVRIPRGADGSEFNKPGILNDRLVAWRARRAEETAAVLRQASKRPRKTPVRRKANAPHPNRTDEEK